jgi:hypothetical protein
MSTYIKSLHALSVSRPCLSRHIPVFSTPRQFIVKLAQPVITTVQINWKEVALSDLWPLITQNLIFAVL